MGRKQQPIDLLLTAAAFRDTDGEAVRDGLQEKFPDPAPASFAVRPTVSRNCATAMTASFLAPRLTMISWSGSTNWNASRRRSPCRILHAAGSTLLRVIRWVTTMCWGKKARPEQHGELPGVSTINAPPGCPGTFKASLSSGQGCQAGISKTCQGQGWRRASIHRRRV